MEYIDYDDYVDNFDFNQPFYLSPNTQENIHSGVLFTGSLPDTKELAKKLRSNVFLPVCLREWMSIDAPEYIPRGSTTIRFLKNMNSFEFDGYIKREQTI